MTSLIKIAIVFTFTYSAGSLLNTAMADIEAKQAERQVVLSQLSE